MKVLLYPADELGCGYHRMIWPAEVARDRYGVNADIVHKDKRRVEFVMKGDTVVDVHMPDVDVIVFQRATHFYLAQAVPVLRRKGVAVVVDVDDDLSAIHPGNDAFRLSHPSMFGKTLEDGTRHLHSWQNLTAACNAATLVTASTPALLARYARHGRGRVVSNYLADHYYGVPHDDSDEIVWPASGHSHPNDPEVCGPAIARLVREGARFVSYGVPEITARLFGLDAPHEPQGSPDIHGWAPAIARHGIGIAPLADTRFNQAKSWLKPLELAAVGVPWVGSPSDEYRKLYALGCGVLARKPKDWYRELRRLRADPALRKDLSDAGREVANSLRLRDHAWRWAEAWQDAAALQRS